MNGQELGRLIGRIRKERKADARKTAEKLLETLRITLPGFSTDGIDKYLLSEEEWILLLISPIWLGNDVWDGYAPEFDRKSVETSKQLGNVYEQLAGAEQVFFLRASDYARASDEDREHMNPEGHRRLAIQPLL